MGKGPEPDAHAGIHPHPGRKRLPERCIPSLQIAKRLHAKVNLIPYNTVEGLPWERPSEERCYTFRDAVRKARIPVTMRYEKGHDINAACGQLRLRKEREDSGGTSL